MRKLKLIADKNMYLTLLRVSRSTDNSASQTLEGCKKNKYFYNICSYSETELDFPLVLCLFFLFEEQAHADLTKYRNQPDLNDSYLLNNITSMQIILVTESW